VHEEAAITEEQNDISAGQFRRGGTPDGNKVAGPKPGHHAAAGDPETKLAEAHENFCGQTELANPALDSRRCSRHQDIPA
jgi:hypothetical protein